MKLVSPRLCALVAGMGLLLGVSPALAQESATSAPGAPAQTAARPRMAQMRAQSPMLLLGTAARMDLSDEQKEKLKGVQEKYQKEFMKLQTEMMATSSTAAGGDTSESMQARREAMRNAYMKMLPRIEDLSKGMKSDIEAILTDEQKKQYEQKLAEPSQMYQGMRRGERPTSAPASSVKP